MSGPKPLPNILEIVPYKGGEKLENAHKLSSNENPLGCSPAAQKAAQDASETLALYPDGSAANLRRAIAAKYGLEADRIICGSGSDEIFQLLGRAYLQPGDNIVQSAHGFLVYRLIAQQSGAETRSADETDLTANVDAMLALVDERTRIVFLANPNNPTGSYIPYSEVKRLQEALPESVLLVLDGAYAEYVRNNDYSPGMEMAGALPNVLMTRTFSKIHGLAALRLGWAYGPESVIDALNRTRGPFNVNALALAAGVAALEDEAFQNRSIQHNLQEMERLETVVKDLGLKSYPSVGNFLLIEFPEIPGRGAADADAFLRQRGVVIRNVDVYGLPNCLRASIGTTQQNSDLIAALKAFVAQ